MVTVAVNIVTFNSAADIAPCLDSLKEQSFRDFRIHVLDNASADDTVARVGAYDVDLIRSSINSGFAKGHNDLIRSFPAEFVLVLNPDTILRTESVCTVCPARSATVSRSSSAR